MKNTQKFLFGSIAYLMASCSPTPQSSLNATIEGVESDSVLVTYTPIGSRKSTRDTIALQENRFEYQLPDTEGLMVSIHKIPKRTASGAIAPMPMTGIYLFRFPNEKLVIDGAFTPEGVDYQVENSPLYDTMNAEEENSKFIDDRIEEARRKIRKMEKDGASKEELEKEYAAIQAMFAEMQEYRTSYIRKNPNSILSAYYFSSIPGDSVLTIYDVLSEEVKQGPFKMYLDRHVAQTKQYLESLKVKENLTKGKPAPDFTLTRDNGESFTLSSLYGKGKYIVLDFWGAWCGWCIKGFPEMKAYYKKYEGKVEFVGIDCNDTEKAWKKAIADNQLPWINVRNTSQNSVLPIYAIQSYPTKLIISPDGLIEAYIEGESPEFYKMLDQLLK